MNKTNNKRIILSLGILATLVFGLMVIPANASAEGGSNYIFSTPRAPVNTIVPAKQITSNSNNSTTVAKATPAQNTNASEPAPSNLAANAIYGSNSFLPSGIIQWIFFAILVLVIVILARKIFGGAKKYHATPMKHA